jgi:sugar lactone lactonase YvrE
VVTPDGHVRMAAGGLGLPNGIGWSPDGRTFYLADSLRRLILCARCDPDAGTLDDLEVFVSVATGRPDGLRVDEEGTIWVAVWDGGEVRRYLPDGRLLQTLPLPVSRPTACEFDDAGRLFITTARYGLDATALARQPLAGSILAIEVGVRGASVATSVPAAPGTLARQT